MTAMGLTPPKPASVSSSHRLRIGRLDRVWLSSLTLDSPTHRF